MATNKTKAKLEEENKVLRGEVKTLAEKLKEALNMSSGELGSDPELAVGLYKRDGNYYMAKIKFNPETKVAEIESLDFADRSQKASHMAQLNAEKYLIDVIFDKLEKKK